MKTYISTNNSRGSEVTAGNPTYAHIRGWHAGVNVSVGVGDNGLDEFHVSMTGGSGGHGASHYLGTVKDTAEGPVWVPAAPAELSEEATR